MKKEKCSCVCASQEKCSQGCLCYGRRFWVGAAFRILIVVGIIMAAFFCGMHYGSILK